jgi:trehalose 6-phosphate synthase/phosphatase
VFTSDFLKGILVDMILQREVMQRGKLDWLLNIGRGSFDEDMFAQVRLIKLNASEYFSNAAHIYSVSLELVPSYATYFLKD